MELQDHYATFQESGVELAVIVVADLETLRSWCQREGVAYPVLADSAHEVAEAYGVYNLFGDGLAAPAVFVIDRDGTVVWHYVGQSAGDWVGVSTIAEHLP